MLFEFRRTLVVSMHPKQPVGSDDPFRPVEIDEEFGH